MVPALICCATVLNAVAFRDAMTLCPAIVATDTTIAAPASARQGLFFFTFVSIIFTLSH
jgi:hypothetical protein